MRPTHLTTLLLLGGTLLARALGAQAPSVTPAHDPSARLRSVLPPAIADRVLATIADARAHGLPAGALEQRALKFAARGVAPVDIETAVAEHALRLARARTLLDSARGTVSGDEIEAGAEAMREGVDGQSVRALATAAPSGRSLAVPLYVVGSLAARGLLSASALDAVKRRVAAGGSDTDLEALAGNDGAGGAAPPGEAGRELGAARRAAAARGAGQPGGGPPAGVPANGAPPGRPKPPTHPGPP